MTYRARSGGRRARLQAKKERAVYEAAKPHVRFAWDEAWRRGAKRMQEDMLALTHVDETRNRYDGGVVLTRLIPRFPDPREQPFFEAVLAPPMSMRFDAYAPADAKRIHELTYRKIRFRPIVNECSVHDDHNEGRLRWYTWEPERLGDDQVERTKVLYESLGKLSHLRAMMGSYAPMWNGSGRCEQLFDECLEDLRRVLGKFESRPRREDFDAKESILRGM